MDPAQVIIGYLFIGCLVSLFIDVVAMISGGLGLNNFHRLLWVIGWPVVLYILFFTGNE